MWLIFGGLTVPENLLTVCDDCHSLIHEDLLVVRRTMSGGLRFLDSNGQDLRTLGRTVREIVESMVVVSRETSQQASDGPKSVSRETNAVSEQPEGVECVSRETRPRSLAELVGQHSVVANLRRAVLAARRRGEMDGTLKITSAPLVGEPEELLRHLLSLRDGDILFIDEIHRLPDRVAETLYEAMEDGRVSRFGETRRLARFTVIGATTDEDQLLPALRDRFTVRQDMEYYAQDDLAEIIRRKANRWSLEIDGDAAARIAVVSRETPRVALALLHSVRDETELRGLRVIDLDTTSDVLESLRIDDRGLGRVEREYMEILRVAGRPLGLGTLADRLGKSRNALQTVHEPFLVRRGLILRTPRGRILAAA